MNSFNSSVCLLLGIDVDIDMYVDRDGDIECIITVSKVIENIVCSLPHYRGHILS